MYIKKSILVLIVSLILLAVIVLKLKQYPIPEGLFNASSDSTLHIKDPSFLAEIADNQIKWNTYKAAWFEVNYPANFTVINSQKSTTADGYESAFFISPDKEVEFYIFSPQWSGHAADIDLKPDSEKIVSDIVKQQKEKTIRQYTIEALDKSYARSYKETTEANGTVKWIIGIKYKNRKSLNKYKTEYDSLKNSLKQFAD